MIQSTTRPNPIPSGLDDLDVRRRWLRRRRALDRPERPTGRIAMWVTAGALVSWLFVAGFAGLGH
jgi:hypothetical protein